MGWAPIWRTFAADVCPGKLTVRRPRPPPRQIALVFRHATRKQFKPRKKMGIERNVIMKLKAKLVTVGFVTILAGSIVDAIAGQPASPSRSKVIFGVVRDIACPLQNKNSTARGFNLDCALACARNGAPLGILTPEGKIFIPISDKM